ncbi:DHA2 family efflux MFS transporter permease subunit [Aquibacillus sp. 3ASR75-11]|uniref:DHA2 family efflux MFS transporter permease subunit n=1 Tax=Terrihalobacillus insolitus TaxID=2950438 RepID=A0A9X3WRS9_9BACI|nr:DHA2 family efflux MFS transporter permease subunit [Terrihalobacillus insolitus]MDC3412210.1 DHA2 family efflux MFS transporter permease subunit [Terrihalobacillus insolitus]MDC3423096.1 DHA2 family efflux MFS transporter permease subunit [Terrihalobacillus insolitus]
MSKTNSIQKKPPYGMIFILFIGAFVAILNETLLNVALPSIMVEFDVNATAVQWLSTGYMLINGILIPASAFFIQRFSDRKLFITAMSLFTVGTFLASIAPVFGVLLVARMVQASGSAIMMPLLMNVMLTAFPVEKRGAAMGTFGLVMITAPAIGPTLSGWLIENYSWRMLFDIVLPIAVLTLVLSIFKLKDVTARRAIKLDIFSLILSSIGFGGLLYGFSSAGDKGWDNLYVYSTIIVGALALITFILRQLRMEDPMLEFRIYKYPMFALSSAISIVIAVALFSAMILMPIYVQTIRGISPMDSGLLMLPGAIVMGVMSPITGKLFDKYGAKTLALIGLTITVVTSYYFSKISMETAYSSLVLLYTFRMFGMSMVMMPVITNGLNQLPAKEYPHGTAMNNTLQQISGAIGSALLITVMNKRTETSAEDLAADLMANMDPSAAQATPEATAEMQQQILNQAMLDGINFTFLISTLIAGVALILAFFIKRVKTNNEEKKKDEEAIVGTLQNATE